MPRWKLYEEPFKFFNVSLFVNQRCYKIIFVIGKYFLCQYSNYRKFLFLFPFLCQVQAVFCSPRQYVSLINLHVQVWPWMAFQIQWGKLKQKPLTKATIEKKFKRQVLCISYEFEICIIMQLTIMSFNDCYFL